MIWRIAPAGLGQERELARLHALSFSPGWSAAAIADLLATPGAFALLGAPSGDSQAGAMALAWVVAGEAEILTLCTDPALRRTGAGQALTQEIMARAAAHGAAAVMLEVSRANLAAQALYFGLGFVEVGRRENYYRTVDGLVDALVLRCRLDGRHAMIVGAGLGPD